jgi:hypothetical protein
VTVDALPAVPQPMRWLLLPAVGALMIAAAAAWRRRVREPSLPRMSDEWLSSHEVTAGRYSR